MSEKTDKDNPLIQLGESLPEIIGPKKGKHLAMTEEVLRVASGGKAGRHEQMKGDLWLNRAVRLAVEAFDEPFDYETDSLQKSLLQQLHDRNPEADVWKQFERAKKVRREALTDLVSRALTGRSYEEIGKQIGESATLKHAIIAPGVPGILEKAIKIVENDETEDCEAAGGNHEFVDYREFTLFRLATLFPDRILPSVAFRQMMDLALVGGRGQELIAKIAADFKNAGNAKKALGIDETEFAMAVNWTNPSFPLWLASENALTAILRNQFGLENVSEQGARKKRNRKLPGESPYPILDFKVYKDRPHEFIVVQGLEADSTALRSDPSPQ